MLASRGTDCDESAWQVLPSSLFGAPQPFSHLPLFTPHTTPTLSSASIPTAALNRGPSSTVLWVAFLDRVLHFWLKEPKGCYWAPSPVFPISVCSSAPDAPF